MTDRSISDDELTELVQRAEEAASVWMQGDMQRYLSLVQHARGYTLLPPTGGPPTHYEDRAESLTSGPSSLLVHRHADPVVNRIGIDQIAAIIRG